MFPASGPVETGYGASVPPLPVPVPPVPPPKDQRQRQNGQGSQGQSPPAPISRYRSLRGKSVSSPRRNNQNKAFDIYRDSSPDDEGSDASPTRHRSYSASTRGTAQKANAAKGNTGRRHKQTGQTPVPPLPTLRSPLNPKPVNLSSPNPSDRLDLQASKSASFTRPSTPEPQRLRDESTSAETEEEAQKRKDREEAARWADEVARLEAETDRILAEQKKRDLARLQEQLAAAPSPKAKPKRLILDKLTFLRSPRPNAPSHPTTPKSAPAKILAFTWSPATAAVDRSPSPDSMSMIEPGGKGIVPQLDAPASASNGGERVSEP